MTGGRIVVALSNLHFTPNAPCAVTVLQAGRPIAAPPPSGLAFAFASEWHGYALSNLHEWHGYAAAGGTPGGTTAGGSR